MLLLGSGGWIPTTRRETCSAYLRNGNSVLLIDAGTGLQRLVERPDLLEGAGDVHIVLTHFHLDHVVGLSYLPALPLDRPPVLWGPGRQLYGTSTAAILGPLLARPLFASPLAQLVSETREVPDGEFEAGGFRVESRAQERHADPTLALRIEDVLAYCTDTAMDGGNAGFARGTRVLLHEAWFAEDTSTDEGHTAAGDAGKVATEAGVESLVLIHVNPLVRDEDELRRCAQRRFPDAQVGVDLLELEPA
jgi:ribonuclease BN (tRNA processing enzyme)